MVVVRPCCQMYGFIPINGRNPGWLFFPRSAVKYTHIVVKISVVRASVFFFCVSQ